MHADADRVERAAAMLGEASADSKAVAAELNLARDAIAAAAETSSAHAVAWQLDDAVYHLRSAETRTDSNAVRVPVRNALQLVESLRNHPQAFEKLSSAEEMRSHD